MNTKTKRPKHQRETEYTGDLQEFSCRALSPDDPSLEARVRRGRPAENGRTSKKQKKTRNQD